MAPLARLLTVALLLELQGLGLLEPNQLRLELLLLPEPDSQMLVLEPQIDCLLMKQLAFLNLLIGRLLDYRLEERLGLLGLGPLLVQLVQLLLIALDLGQLLLMLLQLDHLLQRFGLLRCHRNTCF